MFKHGCLVLCFASVALIECATRTHGIPGLRAQLSQQLYTDAAEADIVSDLPGWDKDDYNIFAGYITVDHNAGRALFYVFVESVGDPALDPVVLWLNGGPGCSSIGGGLMSELGPFYPTKDARGLKPNKHSWNQAANMLFLESPAFVGFSYSNTSSDRAVGDARTARDARAFLLGFLNRFPQHAGSDLYLAGESYAGHYIPQLAMEVVKGNAEVALKAGSGSIAEGHINLKGFLVGNALTDPEIDSRGAVDFWWSHAIISDASAEGMKATCNFSGITPLQQQQQQGRNKSCDEYVDQATAEMGAINIYDIYADVCLAARAAKAVRALAAALGDHPAAMATRLALHAMGGSSGRATVGSKYDPCIDGEVELYLNRPEVQAALHANQSVVLPWRWTDCAGGQLSYDWRDVMASMIPVYKQLLQAGLRMLVYSGDMDAIVPVIGTRRWISSLGLPVTRPWRPWASSGGQVGGYWVDYEGLSFASVRGAGHMVPYTQPERALLMLRLFLGGGGAPGAAV